MQVAPVSSLTNIFTFRNQTAWSVLYLQDDRKLVLDQLTSWQQPTSSSFIRFISSLLSTTSFSSHSLIAASLKFNKYYSFWHFCPLLNDTWRIKPNYYWFAPASKNVFQSAPDSLVSLLHHIFLKSSLITLLTSFLAVNELANESLRVKLTKNFLCNSLIMASLPLSSSPKLILRNSTRHAGSSSVNFYILLLDCNHCPIPPGW